MAESVAILPLEDAGTEDIGWYEHPTPCKKPLVFDNDYGKQTEVGPIVIGPFKRDARLYFRIDFEDQRDPPGDDGARAWVLLQLDGADQFPEDRQWGAKEIYAATRTFPTNDSKTPYLLVAGRELRVTMQHKNVRAFAKRFRLQIAEAK